MKLKRIKSTFLLVPVTFLLVYLCANVYLYSSQPLETREQTEDEKPEVKEYVEVVNVEVIVRALRKGKLVGGLKKSDFTLYEDGKKQEITSFLEVRRKLGLIKKTGAIEKSIKPEKPKRLFFLYFRVLEPDLQYQKALDYFFEQVYREGDYALIMVKNQVFKITRKHHVSQILTQVKNTIAEKARQEKLEKDRLLENMEVRFREFIDKFRENERLELPQDTLFNRLQAQYKTVWEEYKHKHITLTNDKLKRIAASLKTVDLEKWGLVFYQHDTFPLLNTRTIPIRRIDSMADIEKLRRIFATFSRDMRQPDRALAFFKDIQQAFIDANATFHLLLSSPKATGQMESAHLRMDNVHSDWHLAFRGISETTGGAVINSRKLEESLGNVVEKEDIYYRLTYAPQEISDDEQTHRRKLEVKTADNQLKLLYNRRVILEKANEIAIKNFYFSHPSLGFTLNNYQQLFDGSHLYGAIEIKVTAVDARGEMLTFRKDIEPNEKEIAASMKLNFPHGGQYSLIVEAFDKQTGKTALFSKKINVPGIDIDEPVLITPTYDNAGASSIPIYGKNKLKMILDRTANYCEKLKRTAFYFTCREEVVDSYFIKGKKVKEKFYIYNYQIIREEDGKMTERRELPSFGNKAYKEKKTKRDDRQLVITNFISRYPFLMPVTLLAGENQEKYHYQLLSEEKVKGRDIFKLNVVPKQEKSMDTNHGIVWVDARDGSIVKIELHPHAVRGIKNLQKRARRKGTRLMVTDVHWYETKRKGIRFPTRTEISGIYLALARQEGVNETFTPVEQIKTVFSYKKYLFFNVDTSVVDARHK